MRLGGLLNFDTPQSSQSRTHAHCREALQNLQTSVIAQYIQVAPGMRAWGQFLDRQPNELQTGIYGTAAACEILALSGYPADNVIPQEAQASLQGWFTAPASRYVKKGDLKVTYKVAALLNATEPWRAYLDTSDWAEWLRDTQIPGLGWGDYMESPQLRDGISKVLPTARALIALRRYRPYFGSEEATAALRWLLQQVLEDTLLDAAERGLGLLAVVGFPDVERLVGANYGQQVARVCEQLAEYGASWDGDLTLYPYYYPTTNGGEDNERYMHTPREIVVAMALIGAGHRRARRFVVRCIETVAAEVTEYRGILLHDRVFTKQQLWAARLLKDGEQLTEDWFVVSDRAVIQNHPVLADVGLTALLLILALPGVAYSLAGLQDGGLARLASVVIIAVALILLAVAAAPVTRLLRRLGQSRPGPP